MKLHLMYCNRQTELIVVPPNLDCKASDLVPVWKREHTFPRPDELLQGEAVWAPRAPIISAPRQTDIPLSGYAVSCV